MQTTRQELEDHLRDNESTPSEMSAELDIPVDVVMNHIDHVAASMSETGETLAVRPPQCKDCDFDAFDEPLNIPSRCPSCKSERIAEPIFTIQ
jgi:predicted Zn-ribbon and HTH transcriptional regulator